MPTVSMCRKLRSFGFNLVEWGSKPGNRGQVSSSLPHRRFLESLSSLPKSLRNFSLDLPHSQTLSHLFTNDITLEFWEAFDGTLGGPKFSHLTCVELVWDAWGHSGNFFVDQLYDLLQKGEFARSMPKLYSRGILWWAESPRGRAYPISQSSCALAANDRMAWRDLSRPHLFPQFQ